MATLHLELDIDPIDLLVTELKEVTNITDVLALILLLEIESNISGRPTLVAVMEIGHRFDLGLKKPTAVLSGSLKIVRLQKDYLTILCMEKIKSLSSRCFTQSVGRAL